MKINDDQQYTIKLSGEKLKRVLHALEYQFDTGDTEAEHEINTAISAEIESQVNTQT